MMIKNSNELEQFKVQINIEEYAASIGFERYKRESSRNCIVMSNGSDKIIIKTNANGHGVYFNVGNDADHGTIIDFVQNRQDCNLGQVRKELRPWISNQISQVVLRTKLTKTLPTMAGQDEVIKAYSRASILSSTNDNYLISRGLTDISNDKRFNTIKVFNDSSVIFPHFEGKKICGYERKGRNYTGFSSGGIKRLWCSSNFSTCKRLVVAETAIDALSHALLFYDAEAAYASFGGSMSNDQLTYLAFVITEAIERDVAILVATDNDAAGDKFATTIKSIAKNKFERHSPPTNSDWNDVLMKKRALG